VPGSAPHAPARGCSRRVRRAHHEGDEQAERPELHGSERLARAPPSVHAARVG
jgi:hypothetical protein